MPTRTKNVSVKKRPKILNRENSTNAKEQRTAKEISLYLFEDTDAGNFRQMPYFCPAFDFLRAARACAKAANALGINLGDLRGGLCDRNCARINISKVRFVSIT